MTKRSTSSDGIALRTYLLISQLIAPIAKWQLKRRIKKGKEHPQRFKEKLGITEISRPNTTLVWMHGVGLGEVMALRGLILSLLKSRKNLTILVTSSTRVSAEVFNKHITPNTIHQFLPLDTKSAIDQFLNHWQPDISVWAEQDLWPALVTATHRRQIPLLLVNARMNQRAYRSRKRLHSLYRDLYQKFNFISAQDQYTANHMRQLGASVSVGGSLKSVAVPLDDMISARKEFLDAVRGRPCWLLASSHLPDETLAIETYQELLQTHPQALLIVAPRLIDRRHEIQQLCSNAGLQCSLRADSPQPTVSDSVYIADTFGEMGIWYRVVSAAFIGGSMGSVQGHNPWEAVALDCPVIYGPNTENFSTDYQTLKKNNAAINVTNSQQLLQALLNQTTLNNAKINAGQLVNSNKAALELISNKILALLPTDRS